jgi:signal-transduction protein with cAMP-binding, CBS, and nucleotidyltransferase domain
VLLQETIDFLGRTHPLDPLPATAIEELCESAGLGYFRLGATILGLRGVPSRNLDVLTRGTIKRIGDGREDDVPATIDDQAILEEISEALRESGDSETIEPQG